MLQENPEGLEPGEYRERETIMAFFRRFVEDFEDFSEELLELQDAGPERAIALIRYRGRGRASGAEVDTAEAWLVTVRDGLFVDVELHLDVQTAREVAARPR